MTWERVAAIEKAPASVSIQPSVSSGIAEKNGNRHGSTFEKKRLMSTGLLDIPEQGAFHFPRDGANFKEPSGTTKSALNRGLLRCSAGLR